MAGPRTGHGPLWMTGAEGSLAERQGWAMEQHSPVLPSPSYPRAQAKYGGCSLHLPTLFN